MEDEQAKQQFERAVAFLGEHKELKFSDQDMLLFYGYYKQALVGKCDVPKPSFFDFRGRAKWDAWNSLGTMDKTDAMQGYITTLFRLVPNWDAANKDVKDQSPPVVVQENSDGTKKRTGMLVFSTPVQEDDSSDDEETKDLCYYAMEGDVEKIKSLLDSKPPTFNVEYQDDSGMTALHWACERGHTQVVEELLKRGAKPNHQDADGQTALHFACQAESEEIVKLLIAHGADASIVDSEGESPLDATDNETIKKLLAGK